MPELIDRRSRGPCPNTERSSLLIDTPVWLPPTIATSPDCTLSSIPSSDDGRREETVAVVVLESHSTPMTAARDHKHGSRANQQKTPSATYVDDRTATADPHAQLVLLCAHAVSLF